MPNNLYNNIQSEVTTPFSTTRMAIIFISEKVDVEKFVTHLIIYYLGKVLISLPGIATTITTKLPLSTLYKHN